MNPVTLDKSQRKRLEKVATDYKSQGYDVTLQPGPAELPDFLTGFEPDLIATGKGETVVVEVKTRGEFNSVQHLEELESALRSRPGWRFELIIEGTAVDHRQTLSVTQIRASLEEATELQKREHPAAALLLLWSATEGALRLLADREGIELESLTPGYVVKRLYTLGLLGRAQYQILDRTMQLRHQAAHGFQVSLEPEDLVRIAALLGELLSEVEMNAA